MDADVQKKLRAPFDEKAIGKLPRVWCGKCRNAPRKVCEDHQPVKCDVCKNKMTTAHLHLDYVGHAAITDRLLQVDPEWTWEPVAFGPDGLPVVDKSGGLWIRLTVAGVTRLGYGDAEGKTGPAAVKEAIGDALRNGAMRFGVGLDLWHKDGTLVQDDEPAPPAPRNTPQNGHQGNGNTRPPSPPATDEPAPDSPADGPNPAAFDVIKAAVEKHGWDRQKVADRYATQFSEPVDQIKSVPRAKAFVKLVSAEFGTGDTTPAATSATNGAAQ